MSDQQPTGPEGGPRREQLRERLLALRQRVAGACADVGRDPGELTVVVVTKTFPVTDALVLADLGTGDLGESRDQEAREKVEAAAASGGAAAQVRWHFVGRLQSNKAGSVARYAHAVHSVDRLRLVRALQRGAQAAGTRPAVLLQVSLDGDPERGGVAPVDLAELADAAAAASSLRLAGVMAVAPRGGDPRPAFDRLLALSRQLRHEHPGADAVSAGMSGDLEAAVAAGATHLRVGGAVLGSRPALG